MLRSISTNASNVPISVGLLTGGFDKPYVFGLAMALVSAGIRLDVIGGDGVDRPEFHITPNLTFLNLRGDQQKNSKFRRKLARVLAYYVKLICYAAVAEPKIFHILWNNRIEFFDRTLLMLYYKLMGKKILLTAHNVNAGRRDNNNSLFNRFSLKIQYRLADKIFVHTEKMRQELCREFGISSEVVTVIPFGINNSVPHSNLTVSEAKQRLGIEETEKTILFFGAIRPYKGLENLVSAFQQVALRSRNYRLIIAGEAQKGSEVYLRTIQESIAKDLSRERIIQRIEFIQDSDTEVYFKAADVCVLPYTLVFQSGVLFLAYSFGLPVIATDVGSFSEEIIEGKTGFLCKSCDAGNIADTIEKYFSSNLYENLGNYRREIQNYANARNSWDAVGEITRKVYAEILAG